jgi:hypothetical protein
VNRLPSAGDDRWQLPRHAHVVVYEADAGDELVTVYDCGAAQKPPSAQFTGHLVRVRAESDIRHTPTGYVVRLRDGGVLERQGADHWVIAADEHAVEEAVEE